MLKIFFIISFVVYGIGCGVSQSLMSLGGALFAIAFIPLALYSFRPQIANRTSRRVACLSLLLVGYLVANLLLRVWDDRSPHTLGGLPLLWVPAFGGLVASFRSRDPKFFSQVFSGTTWSWILWVTSLALAVSCVYGIYQFAARAEAATGFLKNQIYYGYNLLPAFLFFGEFARRRYRIGSFGRGPALATMLLSLAALYCSMSRVVLLCSLIYSAYFLWNTLGSGRLKMTFLKRLFLSLVVVCTTAGGLFYLGYRHSHAMQDRIQRSLSLEDPSLVWRTVAWRHNWELFTANPLFGVGPEKNGIDTARMPQYAGHWAPNHLIFAHSIYLQALADSGALGFILLVTLFATLAWLSPWTATLLLFCAVAGLTENTFNNSKAAHSLYFYTLLSLCLTTYVNNSRPRHGEQR